MSPSPAPRASESILPVLCIMCVASIEYVLNGMMNFSAPYIMGGIGAAPEEFSYSAMAYAVCAVLALFNHQWCTERLGARGLLRGSLGVFAAGTVICAVANAPATFIVGRAIQGLGGAAFFTGARVEVNRQPAARRIMTLLCFGYALLLGAACGPILGSLALRYGNWRLIFWGMLPWLGMALLATRCFSAETTAPGESPARYHPRAFIWLVAVVLLLQYLIQQTPYDFFGRPGILLACLALALIAGVGFMARHRQSASDLARWRLLAQKRYLFGLVFYSICYCLVAANSYILPVMVQQGIGFDVPTTGLLLSVSFCAGILFASLYAVLMLRGRVQGLKPVMVFAMLMLAGFGILMSGLDGDVTVLRIAAILVFNGAFLSCFIIAVAQGTFSQVDAPAFTHAYQTKNIVRQVSLSGAVALSTVFLQARNALHFGRLGERYAPGSPWLADALANVQQSLPGIDTGRAFSLLVSELTRQSMLLSCLEFYRLEMWLAIALALFVAAQRTFR
jgi:MFS transporter, DHA2 family, multidrug resistance protein